MEKKYPKKAYIAKMKRMLKALENGKAFSIQVKGKKITVPVNSEISIEYEKDEKNELEFQIKW